jgi:hypothetical protein
MSELTDLGNKYGFLFVNTVLAYYQTINPIKVTDVSIYVTMVGKFLLNLHQILSDAKHTVDANKYNQICIICVNRSFSVSQLLVVGIDKSINELGNKLGSYVLPSYLNKQIQLSSPPPPKLNKPICLDHGPIQSRIPVKVNKPSNKNNSVQMLPLDIRKIPNSLLCQWSNGDPNAQPPSGFV